jgi:hypothetical protein
MFSKRELIAGRDPSLMMPAKAASHALQILLATVMGILLP